MQNVNAVVVAGNLTKDPELRSTPNGASVCKLRIAVNSRIKRDGEWQDKPNYFDVTVWGNMGENVAKYLTKGSGIIVQGRLDWHEWEAQDGSKRQAVEIVAENTQWIPKANQNGGGGQADQGGAYPDGATSDVPADTSDLPEPGESPSEAAGTADDDIPF